MMLAAAPLTARDEWRAHWPLVLAAMAGFSFQSVAVYSMGLMMEPLNREFGWSRAQVTAGLSIAAFMAVPLSPLVGAILDRWGSRRLAIPGIVLTSLAVAGFGLANGSFAQWMGLWTFYAVVVTGMKSTVWSAAITGTFAAARGMALGVTLSGAALAQIVTPPLTRWLIETQGWREAYAWLGLGWGGFGLALVLLFLFDAHDHARRRRAAEPEAAAKPAALPGLGFREAFRSVALIRIAASTLITMFLGVALIVHQVPVLTEAGVSRTAAAYFASVSGVAGIVGKLATGWMTDRWNAARVSGITLAAPAIAFTLLLEPFRTPALIVIAMVIIGYSSGAKLQISAYLTSQYGGMRNFGKIYGVIASLIAVGTGLGPIVAGGAFDAFGSYTPFILAGIPGSLICGLLIYGLGPAPVWNAKSDGPAETPFPPPGAIARSAPGEAV